MHPLRLFIVFFALFFVVRGSQMTALEFFRGAKASAGVRQKIEAKASAEGTTFDAARRHVDVRLAVAFKTSYVFAVVLNGFWLWLLFRKQRQYVAEHVVTALHWACFSMALVTAASVVAQYFSSARVYPWEVPTYLHAPLSLYMGLAARRVYGPHQGKITVAIVLAVTGAIAIPALVTKRVLMASLS